MKQDPRGPRDFYAPPQSAKVGPDTPWRRVTYVLAPLYVLLVAGVFLLGYLVVSGELAASRGHASPGSAEWVSSGLSFCFVGAIVIGWLLSIAAFLVRRHEKTPTLAVFVLLSGCLSFGLFALVSLPIDGGGDA